MGHTTRYVDTIQSRRDHSSQGDTTPVNSFVAFLWGAPRPWRYATIAALLLLVYVLGLAAVLAPVNDSGVAAWWPAAAAGVLALCLARGSERWLVVILVGAASVASNVGGGRPWPVALGFGLANALETGAFVAVYAGRGEPARLDTVRDVLRFTIAATCGALAVGVTAAGTAAVFAGGSFGTVLLAVVPSHAFAVFALVPLALTRGRRERSERHLELLIQIGFMLLVVGAAYGPGQSLPISFVILPLLTWAAFRFGIRVVAWELCATALVASGFSSMGVGYFASASGTATAQTGSLVHLFLVTYATSVLLLAAELAQRDALLEREREVVHVLRDLDRQKDDFVSSVSHELRTPITSILGYAEELEDTDLSPEQAQFTRVVVRNSHRLAQLVENLLDLSSMSLQSDAGPVGHVDLRTLVTECVEELAPQAHSAGVTLTAEFGDGVLTLQSSASDVRRVLTNLVGNAVKFTPAHGHVWVGCTADADGVLLTVSDNGIGIPAADVERVFDRFYRSASAESLPGTGLGLPLTKGLVDRLGGTVDLQSDGRTGTHVTVALPRTASPAPAGDSSAVTAGM